MKRRDFIKLMAFTAAGAAVPISVSTGGWFTSDFPELKESGISFRDIRFIDILPGIEYYMDREMIAAYRAVPKSTQSVFQWNDKTGPNQYTRKAAIIQPVAFRTKSLRKGCKRMAKVIEEIHRKYGIRAALNKGTAFQLQDGSYAITAYVGVDSELFPQYNFHNSKPMPIHKYAIFEGDQPQSIDWFSRKLKDVYL